MDSFGPGSDEWEMNKRINKLEQELIELKFKLHELLKVLSEKD